MTEKLNIEDIKQKLYDKLEPSGWALKLRSFIFSSDFDNIITQLAKLATDGKNENHRKDYFIGGIVAASLKL
jgi:hypothetical protein